MVNHLAVAGTFDHFHKGHRFLLDLALEQGEKVSIGVTNDEMTKGKILTEVVEPHEIRMKNVQTFMQERNALESVEFFILEDIYGIARSDKTLEAVLVTQATESNAQKINVVRSHAGLQELKIITAPLLEGEQAVITSTAIRMGHMNREGVEYSLPFQSREYFTATEQIRNELKEPIGDVLTGVDSRWEEAGKQAWERIQFQKPPLVITVGDIVTFTIQKLGYEPNISFIDHKSRRKIVDITHRAVHKHGPFQNKPGTIVSRIALEYAKIIPDVVNTKDHHQFIIEGEEDMLGLAAILLAPLGSVVLYGQFNQGIVFVTVDEARKEYCYSTLQRLV